MGYDEKSRRPFIHVEAEGSCVSISPVYFHETRKTEQNPSVSHSKEPIPLTRAKYVAFGGDPLDGAGRRAERGRGSLAKSLPKKD